MRQSANNGGRRNRSRNNGPRNNNKGGGGGGRNSFESNGPGTRIKGNATQVFEKYMTLGRDASSAGNHIDAEGYFQHAEHYYRTAAEMGQVINSSGDNSDDPVKKGDTRADDSPNAQPHQRQHRSSRSASQSSNEGHTLPNNPSSNPPGNPNHGGSESRKQGNGRGNGQFHLNAQSSAAEEMAQFLENPEMATDGTETGGEDTTDTRRHRA